MNKWTNQQFSAMLEITSTSSNSTAIQIIWSVSTPGVINYAVLWQRNTSKCSEEDNGHAITNSTSYLIDGLEEDSTYTIVVVAYRTDCNVSSTPFHVTTTSAAPSAAPSNVLVTNWTATEITVQWGLVQCIHRNGIISNYSVQYRRQDGEEQRSTVHMVSRRELYNFTISQLLPFISYNISVAAVNEAGTGVYSSPISVRTEKGVISLTFVSATHNSITVAWTITQNVIPTSYRVLYSNTDTRCFTDLNYTDTTDFDITEFTIANLEEFTEYNVIVSVTYNGVTDSDRVKAGTLAAVPSEPPKSVLLDEINSTSITITWVVDWINFSGNISGYYLRYGEHGEKIFVTVTRIPDQNRYTIRGLKPATSYDIEVAVVTTEGAGMYSSPLTVQTKMAVKHETCTTGDSAGIEGAGGGAVGGSVVGGSAVGGFLGGVAVAAAVGVIVFAILKKKQKMSVSASLTAKGDILPSTNLAYGHVEAKNKKENPNREGREVNESEYEMCEHENPKRGEEVKDSEYEICDTGMGEATYETVPV